jgi:molybdopterin-guanine dinucleotide biosynthesis protein A
MVDRLPEFGRNDVTGAVLAGGQARRFGADKALSLIPGTGTTFLEHTCRTLAEVAGRVLVVGRQLAPPVTGVEAILDQMPGQGPTGGVSTALSVASTPLLVVVSCDQPLLDPGDLRKLLLSCQYADAAVFSSVDFHFHPLPCTLAVAKARDKINARAGEPGVPLRALIASLTPRIVDPGESIDRLIDIDTPEDLRALVDRQTIGKYES